MDAAASSGICWPLHIHHIHQGADVCKALDQGQPMRRLHNATVIAAADCFGLLVNTHRAMLFLRWIEHSSVLLELNVSSNFAQLHCSSLAFPPTSCTASLMLVHSLEAFIVGKV